MRQLLMDFMTDAVDHTAIQVMEFQLENIRKNDKNKLIKASKVNKYRIVASTSPSRIEAHAGLFRSLMKGIFDPYVL